MIPFHHKVKFTNPNKYFFGINYTTFIDEGNLEYKKNENKAYTVRNRP